jgi:gluconolactonase
MAAEGILEATAIARTDAHEGPVHVPGEDALYFTTIPRPGDPPLVAIKRLDLASGRISMFRPWANVANGMALDHEGRLVVCEQGSYRHPAAITRIDRESGRVEVLADNWRGRPLNSPNDVVVASDGAIWFTDPCYGHLQGFRPPPALPDRVYRLDSSGELEAFAEHFDKPNGLAFAPDERTLYVGDNGAPRHLLAFDVASGDRRVLARSTPDHPDGVKVDAAGRIYMTAATGIRVLDPDGAPLAELPLPGAVNFCFAGRSLLVTADTAIHSIPLQGA